MCSQARSYRLQIIAARVLPVSVRASRFLRSRAACARATIPAVRESRKRTVASSNSSRICATYAKFSRAGEKRETFKGEMRSSTLSRNFEDICLRDHVCKYIKILMSREIERFLGSCNICFDITRNILLALLNKSTSRNRCSTVVRLSNVVRMRDGSSRAAASVFPLTRDLCNIYAYTCNTVYCSIRERKRDKRSPLPRYFSFLRFFYGASDSSFTSQVRPERLVKVAARFLV